MPEHAPACTWQLESGFVTIGPGWQRSLQTWSNHDLGLFLGGFESICMYNQVKHQWPVFGRTLPPQGAAYVVTLQCSSVHPSVYGPPFNITSGQVVQFWASIFHRIFFLNQIFSTQKLFLNWPFLLCISCFFFNAILSTWWSKILFTPTKQCHQAHQLLWEQQGTTQCHKAF